MLVEVKEVEVENVERDYGLLLIFAVYIQLSDMCAFVMITSQTDGLNETEGYQLLALKL